MKTPKQLLKHTLISTLVLTSLMLTTGAHADESCGQGKIVEILEGGWNSNDLMIKLSVAPAETNKFYWYSYIRYSAAALSAERLRGLRATAYLAMAGDKTVQARTHTANCRAATQLGVLK